MSKKKREDFSKETRDIIAQRAAYRCSFPDCDQLLVGPDIDVKKSQTVGECAHIYSAAEDGPRGRMGLTPEALRSPENGIFLCHKHHRLVDGKSGEIKYPAPVLLYYKAAHEQKISSELGFLHHPLLWIKSITIIQAPYFKQNTHIDFARANILFGNNGTGKSILIKLIYCALTGEALRPIKDGTALELEFSNTVYKKVTCTIEKGIVKYSIGNKVVPFCPFNIEVVYFHDDFSRRNKKGDDIDFFCRYLNLSRNKIKNIIENTILDKGRFAQKVFIETKRTKPYEVLRVKVRRNDDQKRNINEPWDFIQLSSTEKLSIMFDLMIKYAYEVSHYRNILLLFDFVGIHYFASPGRNSYLNIFEQASVHFQTFMTTPRDWGFSSLPAWNIVKMEALH